MSEGLGPAPNDATEFDDPYGRPHHFYATEKGWNGVWWEAGRMGGRGSWFCYTKDYFKFK